MFYELAGKLNMHGHEQQTLKLQTRLMGCIVSSNDQVVFSQVCAEVGSKPSDRRDQNWQKGFRSCTDSPQMVVGKLKCTAVVRNPSRHSRGQDAALNLPGIHAIMDCMTTHV